MPLCAATHTSTHSLLWIAPLPADSEGLTLSFTEYDSDYEYETQEKFLKRKNPSRDMRQRNRLTRPPRTEADQAFRCVHCKQFIGAPVTGGRHRNHCPNCLWSRHVDHRVPGDRKSDCHAAMEPIGKIVRRNGEQVILHQCRGCTRQDPNRIAADDSPLLLMRLPLLENLAEAEADALDQETA